MVDSIDPRNMEEHHSVIVFIESLRYRGYWIDAHHSNYVSIGASLEAEVINKDWAKWKLHYRNKYYFLESMRYPGYFLDVKPTGYIKMLKSSHPWNKDYC